MCVHLCTGLSKKDIEVKKIQTVQSQNVKIRPPVPAKQQGSRSQTKIGYQTLPSSFRSSRKADGHAHSIDSAVKRMDDSAIGGSETDSSYDDVDAQPPREVSSGTTESYSNLSCYDVVSHLSDTEPGSCSDCDSPRLPQTQLSSKGYHFAEVKEVEQLKNLVHQLSVKVKVL